VLFVAVAGYAWLTLTTPIALVVVLLSMQGFGAGLTSAPATVGGLSDLPRPLLAQGTAVRSLAGQVGGALSVGLLGAIIATLAGPHATPGQEQDAYNAAFAAAAGIVLVALFFAWRLPQSKRLSDPVADYVPTAEGAAT
jgi:MFS transporter, DHA2 family, lincomycin resistance protein